MRYMNVRYRIQRLIHRTFFDRTSTNFGATCERENLFENQPYFGPINLKLFTSKLRRFFTVFVSEIGPKSPLLLKIC